MKRLLATLAVVAATALVPSAASANDNSGQACLNSDGKAARCFPPGVGPHGGQACEHAGLKPARCHPPRP
jgi:hypothetical protein